MNSSIDKTKLIRFAKLYTIPILAAILLIIAIFFVIWPSYNSIKQYNSETQSYNSQNQNMNTSIQALKAYSSQSQITQIDKYLAVLNQIIQSNLQFSVTSGQVQSLGLSSGLQFNTLSSGQQPPSFNQQISIPGVSPSLTPNNVFVSFIGTISQIDNYINALNKQKTLFVISSIEYSGSLMGSAQQLQGQSGGNDTLNIEVVFFSMPDSNNTLYQGGLVNSVSLSKLISSRNG